MSGEDELFWEESDGPLSIIDPVEFEKKIILNDFVEEDALTPLCPECEKPLRFEPREGDSAITDTVCGCDELRRFEIRE